MKTINTYHVTPPSLVMIGDGLSVFLIGFDKDSINEIESLFEKNIYASDLAFYYSDEPINLETLAWADSVAIKSDYIIVNLDNINALESEITREHSYNEEDDDAKVVFFTNEGDTNPLVLYKMHLGDPIIVSMDGLNELLNFIFDNGD